ncbi:MAG: Uma2 family endonuclease [Planctomycetaceae bacterium]|nr:Uma2 family endonuclease [Planctomycetaceae bacterium]
MSTLPIRRYSAEEYLAWERQAPTKSEFYQGEIFAMSGASREHNLIVSNLVATIHAALRDLPCEVYPSDMRVKVQASGLYTYPDVTIVCSEPQFEDPFVDTLLNPLVLVEVLSESTEGYDRGAKAAQYRQLPSLRELVLVDSNAVQVECFRRADQDQWALWETANRDASLHLSAVDITIPVAEIYRRVEFDAPAH